MKPGCVLNAFRPMYRSFERISSRLYICTVPSFCTRLVFIQFMACIKQSVAAICVFGVALFRYGYQYLYFFSVAFFFPDTSFFPIFTNFDSLIACTVILFKHLEKFPCKYIQDIVNML